LAAELKKSLGTEATLIPGSGGIFEVKRDGDLVYTKAETGRFPKPGEVTSILEARPG
jgi:selenoprotein W-related protein